MALELQRLQARAGGVVTVGPHLPQEVHRVGGEEQHPQHRLEGEREQAEADPEGEDGEEPGLVFRQPHVVEQLRREILSGALPNGTRLRQIEVEKRLRVSSSPVREAFRELATLGLVDIHPHRGATVVQPTDQDLSNIYQIRALLEPLSTAWSAQRISDAETDTANHLADAMRGSTDYAATASLNRRFYRLVARD